MSSRSQVHSYLEYLRYSHVEGVTNYISTLGIHLVIAKLRLGEILSKFSEEVQGVNINLKSGQTND
jgi:hypothetical protein